MKKLVNRKKIVVKKRIWRKAKPQIVELAIFIILSVCVYLLCIQGTSKILQDYLVLVTN